MFRCEVSGKVSKPEEKAYKLVTKTRKKDYYEKRKDEKGNERIVMVGQGHEIVEERMVCKEVYDQVMGEKND